jgi:exo-beta-1,3-glucanase (GH17 family)
MSTQSLSFLRFYLTLALTLIVVGCGGGGTVTSPSPSTAAANGGGIRALSADFATRKAVNYEPYRTMDKVAEAGLNNPANKAIFEQHILEDLRLVQSAGFGLIRLFGSDPEVAEPVLRLIKANSLDIKVYLGMWMAGYDATGNAQQMAYGVALANSYRDIVVAVSVGNESLVSWNYTYTMNPTVLAANIAEVRRQISQPVTTDDDWAFYAQAVNSDGFPEKNPANAILGAIDFVSMHTYPVAASEYNLWDWRQKNISDPALRAGAMMDASIAYAYQNYVAVRTYLDSKNLASMPIIIGETGWRAAGNGHPSSPFRAHPVNQKMYFDRLMQWVNESKAGVGPKAIFYFMAFDAPWKGNDDGWGLFNVNREARYAIQALNTKDSVVNGVNWKWEAGTYTGTNAVYYVPPVVSAAITTAKYTIHADTRTPATEFRADDLYPDYQWASFGGNTASYPTVATDSAPNDLGHSIEITPIPADYGWGLLFFSMNSKTDNLSAFANGSLNFSVKTTYAQKIEVGISTDVDGGSAVEAYLQISAGQYGYCNTGISWCNVSIPIKDFIAANPKIDLRLVLNRFVIADRFANTANTLKTGLPVINIDNIYWAK